MKTITKSVPAILALTALSACGGGGGGGGVSFDDTLSFSAASDDPANVNVYLTSQGSDEITVTSGQYNRDDDTFDVDTLSGSFNTADSSITLDNGGRGLISDNGQFSGLIAIEQASGSQFGVFGIPATDIPDSGTANYAGESAVVIVDGAAVYDLTGTSSIDVDFAADRLKTNINNLDGTRTDLTGVTDVTNVAEMELTFVTIEDGAFEGGFFDLFSDQLSTFESGNETILHNGELFGPEAAEIGGVFTIDDTDTGSLLIHGVYSAE